LDLQQLPARLAQLRDGIAGRAISLRGFLKKKARDAIRRIGSGLFSIVVILATPVFVVYDMVTPPPHIEHTYRKRLRQYQRRGSMILWVGAGLVGLVGLLASNLSTGAPGALNASTVSLVILGGGALAIARIRFEWAATQLDRAIQDGACANGQLPAQYEPWPNTGEVAWLVGRLCVPAAALVYAAAVWWTVA
jgi:hypothetical protein